MDRTERELVEMMECAKRDEIFAEHAAFLERAYRIERQRTKRLRAMETCKHGAVTRKCETCEAWGELAEEKAAHAKTRAALDEARGIAEELESMMDDPQVMPWHADRTIFATDTPKGGA